MAAPGELIDIMTMVPRPRQDVYEQLLTPAEVRDGILDRIEVDADGSSLIMIERKYLPTWAIVCVFPGLLFGFFGLFLLLVRTTEQCTFRLADHHEGGTLLQISGRVNKKYLLFLQQVVDLRGMR